MAAAPTVACVIISRRVAAVVLLAGCTVLSACTGGSDETASSSRPAPSSSSSSSSSSSASSGAALPQGQLDYVSVGDSYAAGYQPGGTTRNGFAYQVVGKAKARGYDLNLVNFGCSGATTGSAQQTPGCRDRNRAPGGPDYDAPQIEAAVDYLREHRGRVGLVTVALGGNDITACATSTSTNEATSCVTDALGRITASLGTIAKQLRAAAGPAARIVGLTYPDVFLGEARSSDPERQQLADLSVTAFRALVNPQLAAAYQQAGAGFADVTAATGAYLPREQAVAKVCSLTYFCESGDIHPRTSGYSIIADTVVAQLPRR